MCQRLWDLTAENTKIRIAYFKEEDMPEPKADFYGGAIFKEIGGHDNEEKESEIFPEHQKEGYNETKDQRWQPEPVRRLVNFRNYHTHTFQRPLILKDWQKAMCNRGLIDIYTVLNGPLRFKPRKMQTIRPDPDEFDPIYDRPPLVVCTKNDWMY